MLQLPLLGIVLGKTACLFKKKKEKSAAKKEREREGKELHLWAHGELNQHPWRDSNEVLNRAIVNRARHEQVKILLTFSIICSHGGFISLTIPESNKCSKVPLSLGWPSSGLPREEPCCREQLSFSSMGSSCLACVIYFTISNILKAPISMVTGCP